MTLANLLPRELRFFLQPFRESAPLLGATQEFSWPRHFRKQCISSRMAAPHRSLSSTSTLSPRFSSSLVAEYLQFRMYSPGAGGNDVAPQLVHGALASYLERFFVVLHARSRFDNEPSYSNITP